MEATSVTLPEKKFLLKPTFTNLPSGFTNHRRYDFVEPSSIPLAGTDDVLNKTDSVNLKSIDFASLTNSKINI